MKEEINEQICEGEKGGGCVLKQRRRTRLRLLVMGSLCSSQNECDFLDQVYANTIWTPSFVAGQGLITDIGFDSLDADKDEDGYEQGG